MFRLALLLVLRASGPGPAQDLLLEGGAVYASAEARPQRASVLLRGGKIAFVGGSEEARRRAPAARVVDVSGGFVFAGWSDAHGHLAGLGEALESADLRRAASPAEAARRLGEKAAGLPAGAWVTGRGWDQNLWPEKRFPDAGDLDGPLGSRPALARRVDGHAVWIDSAALRLAGIGRETKDPPGGRILRRADGTPSGVLVDNAMGLVERVVPAPTRRDLERRLLEAARACVRTGLTEVQDASGYGPEALDALEGLSSRGELPLRVYATASAEERVFEETMRRGPRIPRGAGLVIVRAVKAYADGALGSRGAALLEDYADEPGKRGLLVTPPERLDELALETRRRGWQLWVHAIGDRGNRLALDAFEKAARAVPHPPPGGDRPRIEHAQVVALADIPRFAAIGVIASIQPTHATSDMPWAEARVGPERIRGAYAWRRLRSAGARLAGGSDFPVESENPILGFYAAITRRDLSGNPPGGWRPEERLSRPEALALFTSDAAFASFQENRRGRIAPDFDADLTIFDRDPMAAPEGEIPAIRPTLVVVAGRVVFQTEPSRAR